MTMELKFYISLFFLQTINSLFEAQGWDFEIKNGEIGSLAVDVPWNCLMSEDSVVEVNNLYLCLRPHSRTKDDGMYLQTYDARFCLQKKRFFHNFIIFLIKNLDFYKITSSKKNEEEMSNLNGK